MHKHRDIRTHRIPFSNKFFIIKKESQKRQILFPVGAWKHFLNLEVKRGSFSSSVSQTFLSVLVRFNNI